MKINPKYVDGEPCCGRFDCPEYHEFPDTNLQMMVAHCHLIAFRLIRDGWIPCIPALRRDRDRYKAERDEWMKKAIDKKFKMVAQLKTERDALRCCANCADYAKTVTETCPLAPHDVCPNWQPEEQGE